MSDAKPYSAEEIEDRCRKHPGPLMDEDCETCRWLATLDVERARAEAAEREKESNRRGWCEASAQRDAAVGLLREARRYIHEEASNGRILRNIDAFLREIGGSDE